MVEGGPDQPAPAPVDTAKIRRDLAALSPSQDAELRRRQRGKNLALLGVLIALALLFYAIAVVKFKLS